MAGASALSVPKLKSCNVSSTSQCDRTLNVLKSLSKRHSFDSDEENRCLIGLKFHQYFNVYFKKGVPFLLFNLKVIIFILQKTFKPSLLVPLYFKATKSCFPRLIVIRLLLRCDN